MSFFNSFNLNIYLKFEGNILRKYKVLKSIN